MNTVAFLKPEHLAPIRNINLRAKLIVEGMIAGLHKSPYHGFSAEFLEYRPYRTGESAVHRLAQICENRPFLRSSVRG
jgi:hypothetical protein